MSKHEPYPGDLTDKEWNAIRQHLPESGELGRPPRYHLRLMMPAIFYLARSGCFHRILPRQFPHGSLIFLFQQVAQLGVWERINHAMRDKARHTSGEKAHGWIPGAAPPLVGRKNLRLVEPVSPACARL